jgi:hypothetical protein
MDSISHECSATQVEACSIYLGECGNWWLHLSKNATQEDLENNHFLEMEGEIMTLVMITVKYCPYCGTQLQHNNAEPQFSYQDFTSY